ncbi:MAG TPA: RagB/SusD family nutrient uptake outer membrane protein [Puia sp.]|nr:RagB/SusD family nutrient uptake outer membrane protein [Puia sp.]
MKHKLIILSALSGLIFWGCSKLEEDPKATLTPENYFQTQSDLDAAVAAIYQGMVVDGGYAFDFHLYSFFGSDDLTADPNLGKADQRDFDQFKASSGNNAIAHSQWGTPWAAIYQCNNVIENYQRVNSDDASKNGAAGQAYFIRAWSYYMLVRTFGPVPVITKQVGPDYRPPRDSIENVYALVVSDLKTAIGLLPTNFPGQPGKATQNSARSLLANVYLTMATWPLNQTNNYALAAAEADSVIQSGQYTLVPDYADVFKTNNNSESIFGLEFNVSGGNPDRFYGDCSMPWEEYGLDGNFGWEEFYPEINFFKDAPVCKRTDEEFYTTLKLLQPDKTFLLVPYNSPQTRNQHPFYRKFRAAIDNQGCLETDLEIISMNPSTNKTNDVIRYPQVLLDFAEASDMASGGPTTEGYAAINLVRARAGEAPLTPGLSQTAFRDSVVYERAYEFAAEWGIRWYDIERLQLLPQIVQARNPLENPISANVNLQQKYYAPIPVNEMLKNPQWTQNPGY